MTTASIEHVVYSLYTT